VGVRPQKKNRKHSPGEGPTDLGLGVPSDELLFIETAIFSTTAKWKGAWGGEGAHGFSI
jgi:hypothetical protein